MIKLLEIIDFERIFENENSEIYLNKINQIPKKILIDTASFLISFQSGDKFVKDHNELLSEWFGIENEDIANKIYNKIIQYETTNSTKVIIVNPKASLMLFESVLSYNHDTNTISNKELQILLFKIYLALNTLLNKKDDLIINSIQNYNQYPKDICAAIGSSLPTSDITNYNIKSVLIGQTLKTIFLFEFLKEQHSAFILLNKFLERFNLHDYKDFVKKILQIAYIAIRKQGSGSINITVENDEHYKSNIDFLDKLIVNNINIKDSDIDYLTLRTNPLYKIGDSTYRVIFPLFAVEKIFNGLYFLLREINDSLEKASQINLRQLITYDFSEKYLFYKILERTFENKYFKLSGEQIKIDGAPDFYIRNGNKVFIFESKDILIRAELKDSYDFEKYEKALKEKLYYEIKGKNEKPKAVLQLANFAKILLSYEFNEDKNYKPKCIKIYPIILLHNRQLDILGLNNLINIWFDLEKEKINHIGLSTKNLKRPTIIHIDTLLIMHEQIKSGKYQLDKLLDEYQNYINENKQKKGNKTEQDQKQYMFDYFASFNMYFDSKYGWILPSLFKEKGISLVEPSESNKR